MNLLLVEDDPGIARFVQRGLAAEGYQVVWQRDGRQVHDSLAGGDFSAVILDLGLPDRDGLDLCQGLRAAGIDTPVIMLTARTTLQDRLDGFDRGADDYLSKPFAFAELLARLSALIRRSSSGIGQIGFGGLRMNLAAREVVVGTVVVPLSRREFDVLAVIVRGRGNIVDRATLLHQVWGSEADITDNVVDVYVGYLRRALSGLAGAPAIRTLRGQGFYLVASS